MSYVGSYQSKCGSMRTSTEGSEIVCIVSVTYKHLFEMYETQQVLLKTE